MANINHLGGALIVVVSVICMGEVVRKGRYLNVLLGLAVAPILWFLTDSMLALNVSSALVGSAVALTAIPRGIKTESYGYGTAI